MRYDLLISWVKWSILAIMIAYSLYLTLTGISICYRRVLLVQCGYLFLVFQDPKGMFNILIILIITLMLWSISSQNQIELERNPYCYDYGSSLYLKMSFIIYNFMLAVYSVVASGFGVILAIKLCWEFWNSFHGQRSTAYPNSDVISIDENKFLKENFKIPFNSNIMETNHCSICLVNFDEGEDLIMLPECKHVYHDTCLDQWLRINSACPYCRFNVKDMIRQRIDHQHF